MEKVICANCGVANFENARYCNSCGHEMPKIAFAETVVDIPHSIGKKPTPDKKKQRLGILIGAGLFWLSYYAVQQFFFRQPLFDKMLTITASEINKTCPVFIDKYTRLDNAVALPGNSFQYNYTLVNIEESQIKLDTVKKYLVPGIINNVKTSPDLKLYRDHKVTMIYNYRDKNGAFVFKLSVTPDMYQ